MTHKLWVPRFESGLLADMGDPAQPAHFYQATDAHDGTYYLSLDGVTWTKMAPGVSEPPQPHGDSHAKSETDSIATDYPPLVNGMIAASVIPPVGVPIGPPQPDQPAAVFIDPASKTLVTDILAALVALGLVTEVQS